jgi:AraC-like DNA-binding protein
MGVPCYSARFIQPFADVLSRCESFDPRSLAQLKAMDPTSRIPIRAAHEMVLDQIAQTTDEELGIRAGQAAGLAVGGALDYAMHSAATVRKAIEVGARYTRLFSDSLRVGLEIQGSHAMVRLGTTVAAPRAIPDFAMAYWYLNHTRSPLGEAPNIECSFEHATPANTDEYERTYGSAKLRFGAAGYAFSFDREYLDAPLPGADPAVHVLLCEHITLMASRLGDPANMTHRVREIVVKDLEHGPPSVGAVARQLRMSARTLANRLAREGTSFSEILDALRRDLALNYVLHCEVSNSEIAFRLGFAHVEAFYRAFKRWTDTAPLAYRKARQSAPPPGPPIFPRT